MRFLRKAVSDPPIEGQDDLLPRIFLKCRFSWGVSNVPRLAPTNWQTQVKIFSKDGFTIDRTKGDHIAMTKSGIIRPVIIPKYSEVGRDIIKSNMKTAGMSRDRYFELLNQI